MQTLATIACLGISAAICFDLALRARRKSSRLADFLPMASNDTVADVKTSGEFSAATVATTISLATVILAFAELAPFLGPWLLWPVITTAAGIWLVRRFSVVIWRRISAGRETRPTLHEFLGEAFGSPLIARVAAVCTTAGFLGAIAVELTVGGEFLASLAPGLPLWAATAALAGVGIGYTALGGFRAVIETDRVQMIMIWAAILGLLFLCVRAFTLPASQGLPSRPIDPSLYAFTMREGLVAFIIGIAVINIPTFLADMAMWQRIAASKTEDVVRQGLASSVAGAALSWGGLAVLACMIAALGQFDAGTNPVVGFLTRDFRSGSVLDAVLYMVVVTGLLSAGLSTASTQLMAANHSLHADVMYPATDRALLSASASHLRISRWLLLGVALIAVSIVFTLKALEFSISDLVFAVYGAQLGLVPVVLGALFLPRTILSGARTAATVAVFAGFLAGWLSAAIGKITGNGDLVFLAPAASLISSSVLFGLPALAARARRG